MARPNLAEKDILNPSEAIDYFVLSRRKFYDLLKNTDGEDFLAYYGERKLILRVAFEKYLMHASYRIEEARIMAKAGRGQTRRDSKRRVLRPGERVRADGKYQYKYHIDGKPHFVYSWKLEPTDKLPKGKKPCLSLRELEKQVNTDLDLLINIVDGQMTVCELVDRYLKTKTGVRQSTKQGYVTVQRLLAKESFGKKTIRSVKTSDAKLFLIKLQQEDGKCYSSIHTMPNITSHVCRHTYCSNMAKSGMNPKTMQYLMGHSDISVTMNVYTHIGFDDAEEELKRMEEFRKAQAEIEQKKEKPMSQKMFKVI